MKTETQIESLVSVVVPVYNAAQSLQELAKRIHDVMASQEIEYEILLVNDDSRDSSWSVIQELVHHKTNIRGINLTRNFGQHNALLCGIRLSRGGIIVTLDDDLQNPPESIPQLLEGIRAGAEVVYGTPQAMRFGVWRNMASTMTKLVLAQAMGAETARKISAFRAFRTDLRKGFDQYNAPLVNIDVLLTWATSKFVAIDVRHDTRRFGKSNYTFGRLVLHTLNMVTGFSTLPLRIASVVGLLCALFGFCVLTYVLGRYLIFGGGVPGFPFLASIIAIFSGVQLFSLGIMGEYLARMYFRTMNQPAYLIGTDTAEHEKASG